VLPSSIRAVAEKAGLIRRKSDATAKGRKPWVYFFE
jgi:hypothetical protein